MARTAASHDERARLLVYEALRPHYRVEPIQRKEALYASTPNIALLEAQALCW